jgi:hypothetical protein
MRGSKFIFLTWKLLLPNAAVSAFISTSNPQCYAPPLSPLGRTKCSEKANPDRFVDASRESSDALLKGCGQLLMTTETSLVSSGSYMRSTSSASAKSLSSSPAGIKVGNVLLLIPSIENPAHRCKFGTRSPVGSPTIREAAEHLVRKIGWFSDELVYAKIVTPEEVSQSRTIQNEILTNVNCLIAFHLTSPSDMATASELFQERKANSDVYGDLMSQFAIECDTMGNASSKDLSSFVVGKYDSSKPSLVSQLFPWTKAASHRRLQESMASLFERSASDDFVLALMLFFNQCTPSGISIPWVECSIDGEFRVEHEFVQLHSLNSNRFFSLSHVYIHLFIFHYSKQKQLGKKDLLEMPKNFFP